MLVFSRKSQESVVVGGPADLERVLKVTVLEVRDGRVKLGFAVVEGEHVHEWDLWQRVRADGWPQTPTRPRASGGASRYVEFVAQLG
jgi:sRNA-binding carbon storage regulator CsrA